jgi:hypothetical protein
MSYATDAAEGDYAEALADALGHNLVRMGLPAKGDTIHRAECRFAKKGNALAWNWAEGRPLADWVLGAPWLKPCQVCRPDLPREESS